MKKTVNKLRFMLLLGFLTISVTAWSQRANIEKMSITTQMFLDELAGRISFEEPQVPPTRLTIPGEKPLPQPRRPIATPDTIDGIVYIASFIRVTDDSVISELEALGVEIQCRFKNGTLLTTNIPIDKIEQVAALEGVTKINVSSLLRPTTDRTRTATNVDDVLTWSNDAHLAGLEHEYDGSGVILGIIDWGIDFQHGAFKDKNGNSRIKGAYCYNGSSVTANWTGSGTLPTTDDSNEDHGTHTSTIAGGSSVIVSGTNVTVTDNHANATYGGMAPGADLFLAGTQLVTTHSMNAIQRMCNYADAQGKPIVVNNSWGSTVMPNDGNSDIADVLSDYFGDAHPNHIALFASGNEAGTGGFAVTGHSTSANPLGTIVRPISSSYGYYHVIANAWTRATDATGIGVNIYVLNSSGAIYRTYNFTSSSGNQQISLTGLSGTLYVYFDYAINQTDLETGKKQVMLYSPNRISNTTTYKLAIEIYPIGGSSDIVDIWANGGYVYYDGNNYMTTNGHTWTKGTDDMSANGECMDPNVISVGSYVTRSGSYSNSVGDISDFSSYTVEGMGPQGVMHPWITAPGQVIISGFNHYGSHSSSDLVVNNSSSPYGEMSGTSMATPAASGIVALWFQAAQEAGKDLTLSEVKEIMKQTAIHDQWTNGTNASHFGNGKIDALAGIQYILDNYATTDPVIRANPTELNYITRPGDSSTQQVTIKGVNLTGPITATLSDPGNVFSMNISGSKTNGQTLTLNSCDVLDVTYSPQAVGSHNGTITLNSAGAEAVTIILNGTAALLSEVTVCDGDYIAQTLPVLGLYHDEDQHNQMIYPARKFQGTTLTAGTKIKSMTFYPTTGSVQQSGQTYYFSGINFYNGSVCFKVANLPSGTSGFDEANPEFKTATLTEVWTQNMPTSADTGITEWLIEFDEDFVYDGGDLLIDVSNPTTGDWGYTFFVVDTLVNIRPGFVHYESSQLTTTYLPKVTFLVEEPYTQGPSLSVDPTEVNIEDGTGDDRSTNVTVTSQNLTGQMTTTASNNWSATLNQDNSEMTVTYNGKALHQMGSASVHSNADDLHASVAADYLYTGPIYILGNINPWAANNGIQMSRDTETGIYTATLTAQNSGDGYAYVGFTKRLGGNANDWNSIEFYRFGPMSNDANWALYNQWADNRDVYCPLDTVGGYATIQVPMGTWRVTIDSHNNRFKFTELVVSSSVTPNEGTLDFGTVFTGSSTTQTITITNDGNLPFTPSLGGLSGVFSTDYVPSELAPGESVTITITYTPENSGNDSGTFTLSDGVHTYTWTLVGAAVTPVIHGYVEPNDVNVDFGEKALNETYTYTVRIYNDGDLAFDPAINVSGMDDVFTVTPTTGITIEPGEYYDLTVSFAPTQEGSYSSTFTVAINGESTTVTVTGSASATAISDDIIHSNTVMVPVYKTELDVYGPYSYNQVETDANRQLTANVTNGIVKVLAKNEEAVTGYRLFHNAGAQNNGINMQNWASGNNESSVAYAVHIIANDNFTTYAKTDNTWAQDAVYPINGAQQLWIDLQDNDEVLNVDTWYAPVIVANSKQLDENTYGSRMEMSPTLLSEIQIIGAYDDSKHHRKAYNDPETGMDYVYVTAQVEIIASIPTIEVNGHTYECYMARAWRQYKPYTIGQGEGQEVIELIDEDTDVMGATGIVRCVIGSKDWTEVNADSVYQANEYTFIVKDGEQANIKLYGRIYFKRTDTAPITLRGEGDEGGYYAMEGESNLPDEPTYVDEYIIVKEIAEVTYVNPQGITSRRPFDGVNIVVTRFTDGTTMTTKVLKR